MDFNLTDEEKYGDFKFELVFHEKPKAMPVPSIECSRESAAESKDCQVADLFFKKDTAKKALTLQFTPRKPCEDVLCTANSKCSEKNTEGLGYDCLCQKGYEVLHSQNIANRIFEICHNIDECSRGMAECDPDSTYCVDTPGDYKCPCKRGFLQVEHNNTLCLSFCHEEPCQNNGLCGIHPIENDYVCKCDGLFAGKNCTEPSKAMKTDHTTVIIVGSSLGGLLLLTTIIASVVIAKMKKKRRTGDIPMRDFARSDRVRRRSAPVEDRMSGYRSGDVDRESDVRPTHHRENPSNSRDHGRFGYSNPAMSRDNDRSEHRNYGVSPDYDRPGYRNSHLSRDDDRPGSRIPAISRDNDRYRYRNPAMSRY